MEGRARALCAVLLLFVAAALFFSKLDAPLLEPQEPRHAEVARRMMLGDTADAWLTPVMHGQPFLDKPPLLYWLILASYSLFGVHDWAARLVPGLAGCLTVLVTFLWGRRVAGLRAGLAGALILCLSARYVYLGRMLTFDPLLCLWVVAALAAAHVSLIPYSPPFMAGRPDFPRQAGGYLSWLLSAAACGLGVLTKGPVALALVVVPVLLLPLVDRRASRPRLLDWLAYLAVVTLVAGPWFVYIALHHPGFVKYFFWEHQVVRFVTPFDHQEPAWFFVPGLLLGMLPWTLLLPGLVRFLLRRSRRIRARRPAALGFFLLAAGWGFLFFSLSGCKRAVYILPVFPPLALALGCYLDAILPRPPRATWSALVRPLGPAALARPATVLVLILGAGGSVIAAISRLLPWPAAVVLAALALTTLLAVWTGRRIGWLHCAATTFALLLVAIHVLLPAYHHRFALRGCLEAYHEPCSDPRVPVACYPQGWDSISFYLKRTDVRIYGHDQRELLIDDLHRRPKTLLFLKEGRATEGLLRELPETLTFRPERRAGSVLVGWVHVTGSGLPADIAQGERGVSTPGCEEPGS